MVSIEHVNNKIDKLIAIVKTRPQLKYNSATVVYMLELLKEELGKERGEMTELTDTENTMLGYILNDYLERRKE